MDLSLKSIAGKELLTIRPEDFLEDGYRKLKENNIRHLLVTDEVGEIVGLISDRDFQRGMIRDRYDKATFLEGDKLFVPGSRVGSFMSWPVKSVLESDTLADVVEKMTAAKISSILVRGYDGFVGIITYEDLSKVLVQVLNDQKNGLADRFYRWTYNTPVGKLATLLSDVGI